jgi:hypothetical protein
MQSYVDGLKPGWDGHHERHLDRRDFGAHSDCNHPSWRRRLALLGSGLLDVVLGLIFLFLIFSLVVSGVNEAATRVLAWRSRHLWRALRELLEGEALSTVKDQRPALAVPQEIASSIGAASPSLDSPTGKAEPYPSLSGVSDGGPERIWPFSERNEMQRGATSPRE